MLSSITSATETQSVAPAPAPIQPSTASSKLSPSKPQPATANTDTVQLSAAAQALTAAVQEATETPGQTLQEALGGDTQAQAVLAKEYPPKAAGA